MDNIWDEILDKISKILKRKLESGAKFKIKISTKF